MNSLIMSLNLAFAAALFLPVPVHASCEKPDSLFEEKYCMVIALKKADLEVHKAYQEAQKAIANSGENQMHIKKALASLKVAQNFWSRYREKDCSVISILYADHNNAGQNEIACKIEHAEARAKNLKRSY